MLVPLLILSMETDDCQQRTMPVIGQKILRGPWLINNNGLLAIVDVAKLYLVTRVKPECLIGSSDAAHLRLYRM